MARKGTLAAGIAEALRTRIAAGNLQPGERLPTEAALAAEFGVSRPTVRAALRELEAHRLVRTQHGVGSFVAERDSVRAGLERMDSITESIRATGREPGMVYASRMVRPLLPEEAARMELSGDSQALELRRTMLADGEVVAYSYDLMPIEILPAGFDIEQLDGSIFTFLRERLGIYPDHGVAEVHAVASNHVGWGEEAATHDLFVLLNQLHYDTTDRLVLYSRTYFIEGRYTFTIHRRS
jgi:GntR family transcriptional regulator